MKLKLELELNEMQKIYDTAHIVAEELGVEASEDIFVERNVDLTSVKLQQRIGEIDIDIDSDFTVWMIDKTLGLVKFVKPIVEFVMKWARDLEVWIHKPNASENDQTESSDWLNERQSRTPVGKTEFDV